MRHLDSWRASTGCPQARGNAMGHNTLTVVADVVLQQVRDAGVAAGNPTEQRRLNMPALVPAIHKEYGTRIYTHSLGG